MTEQQGKAVSKPNAIEAFKSQLDAKQADFEAALPSHIKFDYYKRVFTTACIQNPELLTADATSLLLAGLRCASDGLLPDGRQATIQVFNESTQLPSGEWKKIKKAQYMPMYQGLVQVARNTGTILSISAQVAYENEYQQGRFKVFGGDDERIEHSPFMAGEERGDLLACYCIVKFVDGGIQREWMRADDVAKVRAVSKSSGKPNSPWNKWESEMWRKSVLRRALKFCPMTPELASVLDADDENYDLDSLRDVSPARAQQPDAPSAPPPVPDMRGQEEVITPVLDMEADTPEKAPVVVNSQQAGHGGQPVEPSAPPPRMESENPAPAHVQEQARTARTKTRMKETKLSFNVSELTQNFLSGVEGASTRAALDVLYDKYEDKLIELRDKDQSAHDECMEAFVAREGALSQ